jgi:hypothetical protein
MSLREQTLSFNPPASSESASRANSRLMAVDRRDMVVPASLLRLIEAARESTLLEQQTKLLN